MTGSAHWSRSDWRRRRRWCWCGFRRRRCCSSGFRQCAASVIRGIASPRTKAFTEQRDRANTASRSFRASGFVPSPTNSKAFVRISRTKTSRDNAWILSNCTKPARIRPIDRIASHIIIQVRPVAVSNRIGLHEPTERRRIDAGFVIIHADLGEPRLAGILEPPEVRRRRNAPGSRSGAGFFVVAVRCHHRTTRIADRDHAAPLIRVKPPPVRCSGTLIPHDWLVVTGSVPSKSG
jgi:hypothetical protein